MYKNANRNDNMDKTNMDKTNMSRPFHGAIEYPLDGEVTCDKT